MKATIKMFQEFGTFCADGQRASEFRHASVDPMLVTAEEIVFDFSGVRNASSSFMNALIANLIAQNGEKILKKAKFSGCNPTIRYLIQAAVELGIQRHTSASTSDAESL